MDGLDHCVRLVGSSQLQQILTKPEVLVDHPEKKALFYKHIAQRKTNTMLINATIFLTCNDNKAGERKTVNDHYCCTSLGVE